MDLVGGIMLGELIIHLLAASPTIAEDVMRAIPRVKAAEGNLDKASAAAKAASDVAKVLSDALGGGANTEGN